MTIKTKAMFRYRAGFIRSGRRFLGAWKNNLILDSGLNKAGTAVWANCFTHCLFGSQVAPDPVRRDSGATTFSRAGTTITASAGFFEAADVGRLLKWDSGEEVYISAFTSPTEVSSVASGTIAADAGTVWYVNQTALQTLLQATSTYDNSGGANGTSDAVNVRTFKRTFIGTAVGAPVTLTEIGFSNSGSNSAIFDRDVLSGGVPLIAGDIPLAVAELVLTFGPAVATAVGNVATGYDSSGDLLLCLLSDMGTVDSAGNSTGNGGLDNTSLGNFLVATANFSLPAFGVGQTPPAGVGPTSQSISGYVSGNFYRDFNYGFSPGAANGNLYGWFLSTAGSISLLLAQKFDTPPVKTSLDTLTFVLRKSWQRILTN